MKKTVLIFVLVLCMILSLTACGNEMTLNLACGERTGTYSGDVDEDGLPDGEGRFTSENEDGIKWTYEGGFVHGHFEGEGTTTWEGGETETGTYKDDVIVPLTGNEIKSLHTDPAKFKNHYVEITGRVFSAPEYSEEGVALQMWADIENSDKNTIVYILDKDFEVNEEDYIRIVGKVGDPFEGENAFGSSIEAPTLIAREYEILTYQEAMAPTLKTKQVDQTKTQYGYSVTVQKVEFAEEETRVYLKVENNGSDTFSIYSFDAKLSQDGKQYEEQDNWDADYPEIQSDLLVGNSTEGIIAFPKLKAAPFKISIEAYSENWNERIQPYTFNIE